MNYELDILATMIIDRLEEETTIFSNTEFELDDCSVFVVSGHVEQDYERVWGDYFTPPYSELISRWADFDEVRISFDSGEEKLFTNEELFALEKLITV